MPNFPFGIFDDVSAPALYNWLAVAHNPDGSDKAVPSGVSGYALAGGVSAGATSITIAPAAASPLATANFILIDAFTAQAELRRIASAVGSTITFSAVLKYAHSQNAICIEILNQGVLTAAHWGCVGDNSTDDQIALQEAIYQCAINGSGLWLDGQNRQYHIISQPLVIPSAAKLRNLNIRAKSTFAPAESNNAMLMTQSGNILPFTADPATDIITCTNHGIPADDIGVVFQGAALPGGLTAGKFYYAKTRTTNTFQVAATAGGATVDITSAGSGGTAYCEVYAANAAPCFEGVYVVGQLSISGLNGMLMSVQQPGYANKLRVDACDGFGIRIKGQQYLFSNLEMIADRKALIIDNMTELWAYGFDAEGCDNAIYVDVGGAATCSFYGLHFEMNNGTNYSTATSIAIYQHFGAQNMLYDGIRLSMGSSGQTFFKNDPGGGGGTSSYIIRNMLWSGTIAATGQIMVNDVDRGISLDAWDDCNASLTNLVASQLPSSSGFADPYKNVYIGPSNRRLALGSTQITDATIKSRPSSTQTGDQVRIEDSSGNRVSGFNKGGVIFTQRNTVPSAGDLVAGELTLWYDPTNGASKLMIYAKQADGTVKTASVALA